MTIEITSGGWRRKGNSKFWHAVKPVITSGSIKFTRPDTRHQMVAVFDPGKSDYRVKTWIDLHLGSTTGYDLIVDGRPFKFEHQTGNYFRAVIDKRVLWPLLQGEAPPDDNDEDDDVADTDAEPELKDFCIETQFRPDSNGRLKGSVEGFPDWMRATDIEIDATPRGQGTAIRLHTSAGRADAELALLRINGHWLWGMPYRNGSWLYSVPPPLEDEIREYGDGLTTIEMKDEIRPPRIRAAVRRLCLFLRDNGTRDTGYSEWRDDVMQMNYRVFGMCTAHGQGMLYQRRRDDYARRKQHWDGLIKRYYDKRAEVLKSLSVEDWISTDGTYRGWARNSEQLRKTIESADKDIERFASIYEDQRKDWDERLARCEEREERFADAIALLHPRV